MVMSNAHFTRIMPPMLNGDEFRKTQVPLSGAGTPTVTGTVPEFLYQLYHDTAGAHIWMATAISSPPVVGNWKLLSI